VKTQGQGGVPKKTWGSMPGGRVATKPRRFSGGSGTKKVKPGRGLYPRKGDDLTRKKRGRTRGLIGTGHQGNCLNTQYHDTEKMCQEVVGDA